LAFKVRLDAGKFNVIWNATCGAADWLECLNASGILIAGSRPEATFTALASATAMQDYSKVQAAPVTTVTVQSQVMGQVGPEGFSGKEQLLVQLQVVAEVDLNRSLLVIANSLHTANFGIKEEVYVSLRTFDYEGLPINRKLEIYASVVGFAAVKMDFDLAHQTHVAMLAPDLFPYAGEYTISVVVGTNGSSSADAIAMGVMAVQTILVTESHFVQNVATVVIAVIVVLVMSILAYWLIRYRQHAKEMLFSFIKFELLLSVDVGLEV
jgi:ABC-type glycerol-3-phosphate transport system permease component